MYTGLVKTGRTLEKSLDNNSVTGTVLMDLSKVFDCVSHDLLTAKLYVYEFGENW